MRKAQREPGGLAAGKQDQRLQTTPLRQHGLQGLFAQLGLSLTPTSGEAAQPGLLLTLGLAAPQEFFSSEMKRKQAD